ncbi:MAG: hypothetical protein M0Z46_19475 [Actinomycetota bacterium]|nr:hypothetical protein [Actinomycetota bacterium]
MAVRVRYAGLRNRVRVTDGHEAQAKAAQLRKPPGRIGLFILRLLGYQGQVAHRGHGRRGDVTVTSSTREDE